MHLFYLRMKVYFKYSFLHRNCVMKITYIRAPDLDERVKNIVEMLGLTHIDVERVRCVRSYGTNAPRTLARIHGVSKAFLAGVEMKPHYVIEFLSENFDDLSEEEKDEVIIHELLHIPKTFSGSLLDHGRIDFDGEIKVLSRILKQKKMAKKKSPEKSL